MLGCTLKIVTNTSRTANSAIRYAGYWLYLGILYSLNHMSVHADMQFYAQVFTKLTDVEQNYLQTHKIATGKSSIVN